MKRLTELYKRFRFLLVGIPFLVLLLPIVGGGWHQRFWEAVVLLSQCPFIAFGLSIREDESISGLFPIVFLIAFFLIVDQFSAWAYRSHASVFASIGVLALMIVIEVFSVEIIGYLFDHKGAPSN